MNNMRMGTTILGLMVFVAISAAAEVEVEPLNDILVASKLFPQVVDNNEVLSCIPNGQECKVSSECCPHSHCASFAFPKPIFKCEWCPGYGDTCGHLHVCCPGLTCTGWAKFFSGTCY
ncbi:unnamed protein product [Amaranthus hypochondriacus]